MKFVCLLLPNFRSPSHEPAPFLLIHIMAAAAAGKVEILSSSSLSLTDYSLVPRLGPTPKLPIQTSPNGSFAAAKQMVQGHLTSSARPPADSGGFYGHCAFVLFIVLIRQRAIYLLFE